jgi:excisionase family DNA binding protein
MTEKNKPEPRLMGLTDTAEYLGLSRATLYKLVPHEIPAFKPKGSRVWRFDRKDLDAWIDKQKAWQMSRRSA